MKILTKARENLSFLKNKIEAALRRSKDRADAGTKTGVNSGPGNSDAPKGARRIIKKIPSVLSLAAAALSLVYWLACRAVVRGGIAELWIWPPASFFFFLCFLWLSGRPPFTRLRRIKWLRRTVAALLALFFCFFAVVECLVASGMDDDGRSGLDYIIVLGAHVSGTSPSSALRWRIERAYEYLTENPGTLAVVSGGQGGGEDISEAECMRRELISLGIDGSRIIMEDGSTSTMENITFSLEIISSAEAGVGGGAGARVGVVTNNFHVWRAVRIARRAGIKDAEGIAAPFRNLLLFHYMVREFLSIVMNSLYGNM